MQDIREVLQNCGSQSRNKNRVVARSKKSIWYLRVNSRILFRNVTVDVQLIMHFKVQLCTLKCLIKNFVVISLDLYRVACRRFDANYIRL